MNRLVDPWRLDLPLDDVAIEELDLGVRTYALLANRHSITTVGQLCRLAGSDLVELSGVGVKSIGEIENALAKLGVHLGMDLRRVDRTLQVVPRAPTLLMKAVRDMLNVLTARERSVMVARFGLVDGVPQTLDDIGRTLGVTRERARQIEIQARRKMVLAVKAHDVLDLVESQWGTRASTTAAGSDG